MSSNVGSEIRVTLRGCPSYLARVRRITTCLAEAVGFDSQAADDTTIALNEACANAVRHGSPNGLEDRVCVTLSPIERGLVAEVTDCGGPTPRLRERPTGFGLRLMRLLTDRVEFAANPTGLTVRLTKRAPSLTSPAV